MYEIHTSIDINAPLERVWRILSNTQDYPQWNPFIREVTGKLAVGQQLVVNIHPPGSHSMRFKPRVLVLEPQQELRWLGKLLFSGIFDGEHYFKLQALNAQQTRFLHGESFKGLLIPLLKKSLEKDTKAGFAAMNAALKARAEDASFAS